jgi:hypothetical protein
MKKIIITGTLVILLLGLISLSRQSMEIHIGTPALALCTADIIKNDCCFKFFKVLEGGTISKSIKTREINATAEFKRCLRRDIGCSAEMTEMKCKSVQQIRSICD